MNQSTSRAARKRKFVEKLKSTGHYADFEKSTRLQSSSKASDSGMQRQYRLKSLARRQKYSKKNRLQFSATQTTTMDQPIPSSSQSVPVTSAISDDQPNSSMYDASPSSNSPSSTRFSAFDSEEEFNEALIKFEKSLPKSPGKRKMVLATLFHESTEQFQRELVESLSITKEQMERRRNAPAMTQKIQNFYERDDISRMAAHVEDSWTFANHTDGLHDMMRMRYMVFTLKQSYALFISENADASASLADFCTLRPSQVKLCIKVLSKSTSKKTRRSL